MIIISLIKENNNICELPVISNFRWNEFENTTTTGVYIYYIKLKKMKLENTNILVLGN